MKTKFTFKNHLTPFIFLVMIFLIASQVYGSVKHVVNVTQYIFTPSELTISVGDTVEWKNTQGYHNVNGTQTTYSSNPESFGNSPGTGWTYSHVFSTAGNYQYQCDPHVGLGMVGMIVVSGASAMKHIVNVSNYKFTPNELQIEAGDTVEWQNTQGNHNVNGNISKFPSNPESFGNSVGSGWTYQYVFNTPGNYDYQCDPHAAGGMKGKIVVSDAVVDDSTYILTINFTGMTPHVGENIWLSLSNKNSGIEIERKSVVASENFEVEFSGIEKNHSYNIDFFADHNKNGSYDTPPVDHSWRLELNDATGNTTLNFQHNTNFTDIKWKNKLTVHFMGMNPHVGENVQLAVIEKTSGMEIKRVKVTAEVDFMVDIYGIENGMSYNVDFFADHNENGSYDAPPADHAWRLELNDVMGDTTLNFLHNTNFTDIMWKNELMVYFMGMNPHVGQNLHLAVIDKSSGVELQRISVTATADFMVSVFGIEKGKSYNVDFFADHNKNGIYDTPPADHAWRLELNDVMGDTMLTFHHNTNFTDIQWKNKLTVHFMGMNPHVGQNLHLAVTDKNSGMEIQRVNVTTAVDFMVDVYGIENGMSYNVDFFADHNNNGRYDAPPADHAWRMELNDVMGDTTLNFQHNTNFTDIMWKNKLTVHFMGMNPHVGQDLHLAVIDKSSGVEIQRVSVTTAVDFMVDVYGIENGMSYNVDFFADHNNNGSYDAPPADHAWRMELNDVMGDTTLMFQHNTNFTDINWISTSVSELDNLSFKIYPNPATDRVFVEVNEISGSEIRLSVFDITGKLKYQETKPFNNRLEIDVRNLNSGIYLIDLRTNVNHKMLKLMKY